MTFKEVIYDIREAVKALSIDSDLTDRQIAFLVRNYRNMVIRQFITNNPGENREMLTQSFNIGLKLVDRNRYSNIVPSEYTLLVTEQPIPNVIGPRLYKDIEVRVEDRIGVEIELIDKQRAVEFMYAPSNFIYCYREDDNNLYFISKNTQFKTLENVVVTAILENPEDILLFDASLEELDIYPITGHLWNTTRDMVIKHIVNELQIPIDTIKNNKDEQLTTKPQE